MAGTGLKNILELVYGENAVVHMMSGKAVQMAFRGHLLVSKCLHRIIVASVVDGNLEFMLQVEEIEKMYSSLLTDDISLESPEESAAIVKIIDDLENKKSELDAQSKTSKLWLGYQKMLHTARVMTKADRTGAWNDHLQAVADALSIFAAAGHYTLKNEGY